MSEPVSMTELEFNRRLQEEYVVGQAVAWEEAATWLSDQAGNLFVAKKDDLARYARELCDEARSRSEKLRKKQKDIREGKYDAV